MTDKPRNPKFYVVGGPVQPGRDCYLQRNADAELLGRLDDREYCHVLAQRQTGKTSLVAATARKLWAMDKLIAVVDLTKTTQEDPSANAGRWYYSIAYRIVRDLRIKADVQAWWAERGGLTNLQRLREFFLEVVLEETDQPVVVFFDRIDVTIGEPLAQDLFATIRACYDARATDIDLQRLTFVMVGSGEPGEFVRNVQGSPFEISAAISLPDFSPQELSGLLEGLGQLEDDEQIVRRIWSWTRGHPYLSQKVFRALARRKDDALSIETVDELVQTQYLAPKTLNEEPHLSAIAARLAREGGGRVARLNLYGRIRKGVEVMFDAASTPQRELLTAGIVSVGKNDQLQVRNEIYAMVFGTRWVNQNLPYGIRSMSIAAAILIAVVAAPVWYTEYLPRPYVRALSAANQDYQVAEDAYESLQLMPGYGSTADRLLVEFLARMGRQAVTLTEMVRINNRLAIMPGGEAYAKELLAEFWERRAAASAHIGDRDGALVALLEALQVPSSERRRWAAELVGQDYRNLNGTIHTKGLLRDVQVDATSGLVTLLDSDNQVDVWSIESEQPRLLVSSNVVAEERLELVERLAVEKAGSNPVLFVRTSHPQPVQVQMRLQSPSGQQAALLLSEGRQEGDGVFAFPFAAHTQLASLAAEELSGNWTLSLADLKRGISGELLSWQLGFGGAEFADNADAVVQPIPEPRPSDSAQVRLSAAGRLAMAWPADRDTQGYLLVWNFKDDEVLARIPRTREFVDALFVLNGERLATVDERLLTVWESSTGKRLGEISLLSPGSVRLSENGRYAAIDILRPDETPGIVVWDLQKMRRVGQMITAESAGPIAVDSAGKYLAIGGRDPWVRLWSLRDATLVREFEHSSPLRSVQFDPTGRWLATEDLNSMFRLWNVIDGGAPIIERFGIGNWHTDFADDGSSVLFGSSDRAFQMFRLPDGQDSGVRMRQSDAGDAPGSPVILASRNLALTTDAARTVKLWSVPGSKGTLADRGKRFPGGTRAVLSPDSQRIAVGTTLGDVRIHAAGAPGSILLSGNPESLKTDLQSEVLCLIFSDDRSMLAIASIDGRVRVWNADTGVLRDILITHPDGGAYDLMFIDGGRHLVSASRREVLVTDVGSGEIVARHRIQANHPQLAVAQDTGELFIADDQNGVTLWNWQSDQAKRIVSGEYRIRTAAVTADGTRMVTANDDRELVLWDLAELQPMQNTVQAAGRVDDMWITPDGRLVVQAGYWLQSVGVYPLGLAMRSTRLLGEAPASVKPGSDSDTAFVLLPSPSRPLVTELAISEPPFISLEGDPDELRRYWRDRLSMTLDEEGNALPLPEQSSTMSSTGLKN